MIDGERYHVLPVPELQQEERDAAGHSRRRQVPPQREQGPLQVRGRFSESGFSWGKSIRIQTVDWGRTKNVSERN